MSQLWSKPDYSPRGTERQMLNGIFHIHDLCCSCFSPRTHILCLLTQDDKDHPVTIEELQKMQTCLSGTTATGQDGGEPTTTKTEPDIEEEDGIDAVDLERLFAEDTEDDTG